MTADHMNADKISLAAIDSASLALAFSGSVIFRSWPPVADRFGFIYFSLTGYALSFLFAAAALLLVFSGFRLYRVRRIELSARIFTVLKALLVWTLIITACVYALKYDFSRSVLFLTVIFTAILICLGRYAYFKYRQGKKRGGGEAHIIGTGGRAKDIEQQIKSSRPDLSVVRLDRRADSFRAGLAALKSEDIFIADESLTREQVMAILADDALRHHSFRVVLDTFRLTTGEVRPNDLDEIPSISAGHSPQALYLFSKRLADIFLASLGLIIALPLWLIISAAIKLDSKGPILIRQYRIGLASRPFALYKFRTMRSTAILYEKAPHDERDPRITRVGKLLRRLSLDELPQLWNIFIGDMSLVGPRPEMGFIVKEYAPWQRLRLKVKPGLTGLWQVLGRKDIPLHENLEYDFYYVCNQNAFLDTAILLKTIPAVLFGRGAY